MKFKIAAAGFAASLLLAGVAQAACPAPPGDLCYAHVVSFYSFGVGAPSQSIVTSFETTTNTDDFTKIIYNVPGYNFVDTFGASNPTGAQLLVGSVVNQEQAPTMGSPPVQDPTRYLAVHQGGEADLFFTTPIKKISIYVGSFDSYDLMTFFYAPPVPSPSTEIGSGTWVSAETLGTIHTNGMIADGANNGLLTLTFDKAVSKIAFKATQNAYEVSYIAIPAPEPATWGLMILGFGGIGGLLRQRRRQLLAVA